MPGLMLVFLSAPTRKVAAVVGKKVAKSAVARNLIRRRLYAALYEVKIQHGHVIVVAKPQAKDYSYAQVETEVATALNRVVGSKSLSR